MPIAFMDYRVTQSMVPQELQNRATYILVKLAPGADPERVRAEIRRRLPHNDVWTRDEWAARSRAYWTDTTGLGLNMLMTVFLGCVVGVSVVAQTLYTSTIEHLKEFATVKAIGGGNSDIYAIIGKQAAIAAVAGFALGAAMAYGLRPVMAAARLEAGRHADVRRLRLRGDVGPVPGGGGDLVPEGRHARPGDGVPRVGDARDRLVVSWCGLGVRRDTEGLRTLMTVLEATRRDQSVPRRVGVRRRAQGRLALARPRARSWPWRDRRARGRRRS